MAEIPWLSASFPAWCGSHGFSSLHRCALRVDAELGAGLHTEVTDWGYQAGGDGKPMGFCPRNMIYTWWVNSCKLHIYVS